MNVSESWCSHLVMKDHPSFFMVCWKVFTRERSVLNILVEEIEVNARITLIDDSHCREHSLARIGIL